VAGVNTSGVVVQGNRIGTTSDGMTALPNGEYGVRVQDAPEGAQIGGTEPGQGNLISGNALSGVGIFGAATAGVVVEGNRIGTNADGTAAVPNGSTGVEINGPSGNLIGGTAPGAGNLISGNAHSGVSLAYKAQTQHSCHQG
jgi:hypothetical protein